MLVLLTLAKTQTDPIIVELVLTAMSVAICGACAFQAWSHRRRLRLVQETPTSRLSSAPTGFVELKGEIRALETVESPFSRKPCVWHECRVERHVKRGKHSRWVTAWSASERREFLLDDGSGVALIRPERAEVEIRPDAHGSTGTFDSPTATEAEFFRRAGVRTGSFLGFNEALRYEERFLAAGDELYVLGTARPVTERDVAGRQHPARVVVEHGRGGVFYLTDRPESAVVRSLSSSVIVNSIAAAVCFTLPAAWWAVLRTVLTR